MPSSTDIEPLSLKGQRLFVTGGTGFVGKSLLDYFDRVALHRGADFSVHVLSRDPEGFFRRHPRYAYRDWLRVVPGDLDHLPHHPGSFSGVIHGASDTHALHDATQWLEQIVLGTQKLLDFAVQCGARRFLLLSSGAVYGPQPAHLDRLGEEYPGAPPTDAPSGLYGQCKRMAEQLASASYHEQGLETVSARIFALVSEHLPLHGPYAIGNFIADALAGRPLRIKGDPGTVRAYLDGLDLAHWLVTLLLRGQPGRAYNVGSDRAISIGDLAELVVDTLAPGLQIEVARDHAGRRTDRAVYVPDITRARELGLDVATPLPLALQRAAESIRRRDD